jgi:hypothetical protein
MTEFSDWIQSNWFELGILVILCAILTVLVWFAQNILKTLRAWQEQVGALLKLSLSEVVPLPGAAAEKDILTVPEGRERGPNPLAISARKLIGWLEAPMGSGGAGPWRKALRWLQAPAGS